MAETRSRFPGVRPSPRRPRRWPGTLAMAAGLVTMVAGLVLMIYPASIMPGPGLLLVSYAMVVGGVAVALLGANLLNRADDLEADHGRVSQ